MCVVGREADKKHAKHLKSNKNNLFGWLFLKKTVQLHCRAAPALIVDRRPGHNFTTGTASLADAKQVLNHLEPGSVHPR